jgi:hypothetical protein
MTAAPAAINPLSSAGVAISVDDLMIETARFERVGG